MSSVGCNTFNLIATAKLSIPSSSHHVKVAIDSNKASVSTSAHYSLHFLVKLNLLWRIQLLLLIVAQLTIHARAPGVHVSSLVDVCTVLISTAEVDHFSL